MFFTNPCFFDTFDEENIRFPIDFMHTITLQINNNDALKTLQALENKHFISILENSDLDSPSLSGEPLSLAEFKSWIKDAEKAPTVSLTQAKEKWANKRKQLQKLIK